MGKIATVPFQSKGGTQYKIEIYKRGVSGVSYDLTPAASPFTTEENTSSDPLEPLRGSTGYFRFMYSGELNEDGEPLWADFVAKDATEISIFLTDADDETMWQGFVKPSQYSQDYGDTVREIAVPIVSAVEVLSAIEMDATNVIKPATWRELLKEAVEAADGMQYDWVVVPYEWGTKELTTENVTEGIKDFNFTAPFLAKASRWAWFDVTDAKNTDDPNYKEVEGKTYADTLEDWCRFWGWSLHERGKVLYFVSRRTTVYCKLDWRDFDTDEALEDLEPYNIINIKQSTQGGVLSDDKLDGTGHTIKAEPGVRTVEVDADCQEMDTDVLTIDENKMQYYDSIAGTVSVAVGYIATNTKGLLFKRANYPELTAWDYSGTWHNSSWASVKLGFTDAGQYSGDSVYVGWGKFDFWAYGTQSDKKNYSYKRGFLVKQTYNSSRPWTDDYNYPILEIKGAKSGTWKNGYFVLNPVVGITCDDQKNKLEASGLMLQLEVGPDSNGDTWKWDGTEWTNGITKEVTKEGETVALPISFALPLEFEGNHSTHYTQQDLYDGTTPDQKKLTMDCNGAEGYIIPITRTLEGRLTLRVLSGTGRDAGQKVFAIQDLDVEYFATSEEGAKDRESVNKYYATTECPGTETETISLNIATENNNNPGHGLLKYGDSVADGETFRTPEIPGTTAAVVARPEEKLLAVARSLYGVRRMELDMVVSMSQRERPVDRYTRNEWNGTWYPVAESVEWSDDRRTLTLLS